MNIALIFAGGIGSRMGSSAKPKQFLELYNKPVIAYTIEHFQKHVDIDAIYVVCKEDWCEHMQEISNSQSFSKVRKIVPGGISGMESIFIGLKSIEEEYDNPIVLIHDGVRPLIDGSIIKRNIETVKMFGSAITSCPPVETFVEIDDNFLVKSVNSRELSRLAKAPQSFFLKDIISAHKQAQKDNYQDAIDSCSLMNHYGNNLTLIDGPYQNIKITTPLDFFMFKAIVDFEREKQVFGV